MGTTTRCGTCGKNGDLDVWEVHSKTGVHLTYLLCLECSGQLFTALDNISQGEGQSHLFALDVDGQYFLGGE